ncbi:histidine kinase OS=Ureibacillus acetophenoni OX=614649 GN=SAMN05877842_1126 PE=4 SV=1 [Ureibacillus acetophenoni]
MKGKSSLATHARNLNSLREGVRKSMTEQAKSERLKTELITNVSHDLRTPLTSIITYTDLLKKARYY